MICVPAGITENYIIPDGVIRIKGYAFYGCSSLTDIEIPDGVTSIDGGAFFGCSSLTNISIPASVTSIGYGAFEWCSSLTSVKISDGVISIGGDAFYGCSSLTSIEIPASVINIGNDVFDSCTQLANITVNENNLKFASLKGVLFNKDKTVLICVPAGIKGNYIIPASVTSIKESAFYGCGSLTGIKIPDSVTSIGNSAFYDCSSLTNMTIPNNVTNIGDFAFNGCNSLISITIPKSVMNIGLYAFDGCDSLRDIYYAGGEVEWKKIAIANSHDALTNVTIHYNSSNTKPTVASVKITPDQTTVIRGKTQMFSVEVTGENNPDSSVTWQISGNTSDKTVISKDGVLKVGSDEKGTSLKVEAVSAEDTSKSDIVTVVVQMFKDVDKDQFYSKAVNWGTEHNAVAGYSESDGTSSFRPNDTCTRAQFVTFLWRTLGEQKPTSTQNPFKDISDIGSQYYGTALLWAYENHYVSGYSDPDGVRFGPDDQITRGQVVTFLWRAAGEPKATTTTSPFKDVTKPEEQYYGQAMLWASENGIVSGYSDPDGARFAPDDSCTRGQVVTFLWRYAQKYLQ